ncbi:hypothetical protein PULV_b0056 [Pseudoalteromonas ulvae UL12]|nr:hypothetical protein [Pseudoalteromonas ulvae UL12]
MNKRALICKEILPLKTKRMWQIWQMWFFNEILMSGVSAWFFAALPKVKQLK